MPEPDYFTLAEFRTLADMPSNKYPDADVLRVAAYITSVIEREVGTSFIVRSHTETFDGTDGYSIRLSNPYARSVTSATVDGVALTDTLDVKYDIVRHRTLSTAATWPLGLGNVVVVYTAGYSTTVPADVKEAALQGTRSYLLEHSSASAVSDRRSSVSGGDGGTTSFVLAGPDRPTGYPEVDAVILGWRNRIRVPGVA